MVEFITKSPSMKELLVLAAACATTDQPVLIVGAPATGRKRLGRWIHEQSARSGGAIVLSCRHLGSSADEVTRAACSEARSGTLIVDASHARVARDVVRAVAWELDLCTARLVFVDGRHDGLAQVLLDELRDDALRIRMPSLRERAADLPLLVLDLIDAADVDHTVDVAPDVFDAVEAYPWPDNFTELARAIDRALVVGQGGPTIELAHLPPRIRSAAMEMSPARPRPLAEVERRHILRALTYCEGRRGATARLLGVSRSTLARRLRAFGAALERGSRTRS